MKLCSKVTSKNVRWNFKRAIGYSLQMVELSDLLRCKPGSGRLQQISSLCGKRLVLKRVILKITLQ
jgi:hypothetical protein